MVEAVPKGQVLKTSVGSEVAKWEDVLGVHIPPEDVRTGWFLGVKYLRRCLFRVYIQK